MDKLKTYLLNKELTRLHNMVNGCYYAVSSVGYYTEKEEKCDEVRRDWAMKQIERLHSAIAEQ